MVSVLLGREATPLGLWVPTFRDRDVVTNLRVENPKKTPGIPPVWGRLLPLGV
jgi:hypothetical protein